MITDLISIAVPVLLAGFASTQGPAPKQKIEIVREPLKSLETKDPKPPSTYIKSSKYIQHNLHVVDGLRKNAGPDDGSEETRRNARRMHRRER